MTAYRLRWILLLALVYLVALAGKANAHNISQSFSSWDIEKGNVRMVFSVDAREATRLPPVEGNIPNLDDLLIAHLGSRIAVAEEGKRCNAIGRPHALAAREGFLRVEWRFACLSNTHIRITNNAFFDLAPSHLHYARIQVAGGSPSEFLFTDAERQRVVTDDSQPHLISRGASFSAYVKLGIKHIFTGLDHVAFLMVLLLAARRLRDVLSMVTGFTLGHSITLSLAVLGVVQPRVQVIEALIGYTIALVAAENVGLNVGAVFPISCVGVGVLSVLALLSAFGRVGLPTTTYVGLALFTFCYLMLSDKQEPSTKLRPILTLLFGLIHGFGFASALMQLALPSGRLIPALFGFNVGVEIGQICVVAAIWMVLQLLVRRGQVVDSPLAFDLISAAACGLGLFWFFGRAYAS